MSLFEAESELLPTLPRWGMWADGVLYRLPTPELHTAASVGGVWPTPIASDSPNRQAPNNPIILSTGLLKHRLGDLTHGKTARLSETVKFWSTPMASDWKRGKRSEASYEKRHAPSLPDTVQHMHQKSDLTLNPDWVEQMMGYPVGWTNLDSPPGRINLNIRGKRHGLQYHIVTAKTASNR